MRAVVSGFVFAFALLIGGAASAQIVIQPSTASGPCTTADECLAQYNKASDAYMAYYSNFNNSIGQGFGSAYETNYLVNMRDAFAQRNMYSDAQDYYNGAWWAPKPTFDVSPYMGSANNLVASRAQGVGVSDASSMLASAPFGSQAVASTPPPTDPGSVGTTTPTDPGTGGGSTTPTDPGTGGGSTTPSDPGTGSSSDPYADTPWVGIASAAWASLITVLLALCAVLAFINATIFGTRLLIRLVRS